jgi:hypothetical protein
VTPVSLRLISTLLHRFIIRFTHGKYYLSSNTGWLLAELGHTGAFWQQKGQYMAKKMRVNNY